MDYHMHLILYSLLLSTIPIMVSCRDFEFWKISNLLLLQFTALAAAAAAAAAQTTPPGFLFYPSPAHPFSISALFASDRLHNSSNTNLSSNKNTSIADLRIKAQKHAAALQGL